ncbi:TPA: hypothetical protein K8N57_001185 [Clostridium perfringens]|nr:hypothetical protein [Clostridium perfringens]
MKKKFKLLIGLLAFTFMLTPTSVFAAQNNNINQESDNQTVSKIISYKDIPSDITPMIFNSKETADKYFENVVNDLKNTKSSELIPSTQTYDYRGYRYVQKSRWPVTIVMEVPYLAKWSSRWENYYASADKPTTDISGVTMGFSWRPSPGSTYSDIGSNPTKLTAHGAGYLDWYVLVSGVIRYYSERVTIDGSWGQP